MRQSLALVLLFLCACQSEPSIRWDEASRYIGFKKTVCGLIVRVDVTDLQTLQVYHLGFGNYPNEDPTAITLRGISGHGFDLLIMSSDLGNFKVQPDYYKNKAICVAGTITSASGSPFISVSNQNQIQEK